MTDTKINHILNSLTEQLKSYGLNPNHWQIKGVAQKNVMFQKIDDPEISLKGLVKSRFSRTPQIQSLQWVINI